MNRIYCKLVFSTNATGTNGNPDVYDHFQMEVPNMNDSLPKIVNDARRVIFGIGLFMQVHNRQASWRYFYEKRKYVRFIFRLLHDCRQYCVHRVIFYD